MSPSQDDNSLPCSNPPVAFQRKIRSFVKREGRMSKRQRTAIDLLFPLYGLQLSRQPLNFAKLFNREAPTILEIGFGMGNTLALMAQRNPGTNYVGIEVHRPGVGSLLATLQENNIENVRMFCHDAIEVLEQSIADKSLDGIQIFFPDPWPKKRHHKRRLIQSSFINLLSEKLKVEATLHIATDWEHYGRWIDEIMSNEPQFLKLPTDTPHQRPTTKFEQRGLDLGHSVWDLIYVKKS